MNLARFDLISLRLVVTCIATGSLNAAARTMQLAPAAASRRLTDLEQSIGQQLFERQARGLRATVYGQLVARHAQQMLQQLDLLQQGVDDLRSGFVQHIRLEAGTAAINQFLPQLLARYAKQYPEVKIDLEEDVSENIIQHLRSGRCEVGVFVLPSYQGFREKYADGSSDGRLNILPFRRDELVLVMPAKHPLAQSRKNKPIQFSDCLGFDFVGLTAGAAMLHEQINAANAAGKILRLSIQVKSFDAVCRLVAAGLGLSLLPKLAVEPFLGQLNLRVRPLSDPWSKREIVVGYVPKHCSAVAQNFARFLVEQ
jgi:DNA-binding transcriptional LysR family regulator